MAKKINTELFLKRVEEKHPDMFSMNDYSNTVYSNSSTKIEIRCKEHGLFQIWPGDHLKGMSGCKKCISLKRKRSNMEKYGVEHYFQRSDLIKESVYKKYGVTNPGLMPDHLEKIKATNVKKYGMEWAASHPTVNESRKKTNLEKYGVDYPMQNPIISKKSVKNKIANGGFTKSNSSAEATNFIKNYIKQNNYELEQCAFADEYLGLHEWGIYHNGRWILYDLVVFEKGFRGNKDKIIEILEYHGPFHYSAKEVEQKGNNRAYPWKSNKTTIKESYQRDLEKEILGKTMTQKYIVIHTRKEGDL